MSRKFSSWADDSDSDLEPEAYNTSTFSKSTPTSPLQHKKEEKSTFYTAISKQTEGPWAFILSNLSYYLTLDELKEFYKTKLSTDQFNIRMFKCKKSERFIGNALIEVKDQKSAGKIVDTMGMKLKNREIQLRLGVSEAEWQKKSPTSKPYQKFARSNSKYNTQTPTKSSPQRSKCRPLAQLNEYSDLFRAGAADPYVDFESQVTMEDRENFITNWTYGWQMQQAMYYYNQQVYMPY